MIQQTAPIVATAILYSLCAGAICYALLRAVLAAGKGRLPVIMYHLCNIMLLIPLIVFVQPLSTIGNVPFTAPIIPAGPATIDNTYITAPYTPGTANVTASPGASFSLSGLWIEINTTIATYSHIIMALYIAGLLLFSFRLLIQYVQSRRMRTTGTQHPDATWLRLLNSTKKKLGIEETIDLAFTTRNIAPCIIGHAKAMILIPVSLANNLTTEQAEAVLLHELAHYKQYDYYINLLTQCINCILFFNPFTWLITKQANNYRELACDATAAGNGRNIELAEALAIIARIQVQENSLSLSLQKKGTLLKRVQVLLNIQPERSSNNRILPFAIITLITATALLLGGNTKIFSTERDTLKERLHAISKQMYEEGNYRYIFVDAVADSLVQLPFRGDLVYFGKTSLMIQTNNNYKAMTNTQQKQYCEKLQSYLVKMGEEPDHIAFSALGNTGTVTLENILSSSSDFRTIEKQDMYEAGITTRAWKKIFSEMYDDGLVKSAENKFRMEYDKEGILINGEKLQGQQDNKYRRMFKEILGLNLEGDNVSGSMRMGDLEKYLVNNETGFTNETWNEKGRKLYAIDKQIRAEMHKDGLLDTNYKSIIVYRPDFIAINNCILAPALVSKYDKMFAERGKLLHANDGYTAIITDKGEIIFPDKKTLKGKAMLLPANAQQKGILDNAHEKYVAEELNANMPVEDGKKERFIFREMHKDGLLDTNYKMLIVYTPAEIWVNNLLLAGAMERKYTGLFKNLDRDLLVHDNYTIAISEHEKRPYPAYEKLHGRQYLLKPDAKKKAEMNKWQESHDENMKRHDEAMAQHDKAMLVHDREMEKHDREIEKLDREMEKHDREMAKHDKEMEKLDKEMEQYDREIEKHNKALKEHEKAQKEHKKNRELSDKLIGALTADKLIRDDLYYLLEYRTDGLYINARKLEGKLAAKYDKLLDELGYKKGTGMIQERIPDGVAIPDWKHGNSSFHLSVHGNNLPAIAEKMFTEGNPNFILAHALHDGLLGERQNYSISYDHGKIRWQGKALKEPYASKYTRLMNEFFKAHGKMDTYNMRGEGVTIKNLNTPSSHIRQQRLVASYKHNKADYNEYIYRVLGMLAKDGLVDTTKHHSLKYNARGIFVNGNKLEKAIAARYEPILQKGYGRKPSGLLSDDGLSYTNTP